MSSPTDNAKPTTYPPPVPETCPRCGSTVALKSDAYVYGESYGGRLYVCLADGCDTYVGVHEGTTDPKGTMAGPETRRWRKVAHAAFDPLWQRGPWSRSEAYDALQRMLRLPEHRAHIGMLDAKECRDLVDHLAKYGPGLTG